MDRFNLSHAQKRIIDTELVTGGTNINLLYQTIAFPAGQADNLIHAIRLVLDQVPDLHRRFAMQASGQVDSYISREKDDKEILYEEVHCLNKDEARARLQEFLSEPFPEIFHSRLFQFMVLACAEETLLGIRIHHAISDSKGLGILSDFIIGCFESYAYDSDYSIPKNSYEKYMETEADYLKSPACDEDRAYFRQLLADLTDCPDSLQSSHYESGGVRLKLPAQLTAGLNKVFIEGTKPVSPFLLSLALINVFLARYYRSQTIAMTAGYHGRNYDDEINQSIGMMVSTVPLKIKYHAHMPFSSFLDSAKAELKAGLTHSKYPLDLLLADLRSDQVDPDRLLNFTIVSNAYRQNPNYPADWDGYVVATMPLVFRINLMLDDRDGLQTIDINYRKDIFTESEIRNMAGSLKAMLEDLVKDPDSLCSQISLVSSEVATELASFNHTGHPYEKDTIVGLFRKQAEKTPDRPAVTFKERTLTYRELDQETDLLARYLVSMGTQAEDRIAILIDRSEYMMVYPLAVMKAGAAYLPLDPTFPAERLEYMINDAGVNLILSEAGMAEGHIPGFQGQVILKEDLADIVADILADPVSIQLPKLTPSHAFVVLYTSGSTGLPKGCILEHSNLVNFCKWYKDFYELTEDDRGGAYANFAFDAHMLDLFTLFTFGGQVYIVPSEMRLDFVALNNFFEENHITVSFLTTMLGKQFLDTFDNHSLRALTIGGESMPKLRLPAFTLFNGYGPTECTMMATVNKVKEGDDGRNIGKPIGNCGCHILDDNLRLLPIGAIGELCISGAGVGRGYLNRPELTAEKFVDWQGLRIYRTGDYARWTPEGEIEFFGRIDGQVKLRGLRIELEEIEKKIDQYPGITGSAVAVKTIGGSEHLVAYYTSSKTIDIDDLKEALATELAAFMIPTSFNALDKIPLTANGKVNRKVLPEPIIQKKDKVLARSAREESIHGIVAEVLTHDDFGVTDDLFTVGLTSLLAIRLSVLLWNKAGLKVAANEIMKGKTIEHMAKFATVDSPATSQTIDERKTYPLTGNQLGVFVDSEKNPDTLIYNIPMKITCKGKVDPDRLRNALIQVIDAHPYLKTQLAYEEGQAVQVRRDLVPAQVDIVRDRAVDQVLAEFLRPFTLMNSDLYRAMVVDTRDSTILLLDVHHLIFDGGSQLLFFEDLKSAFGGLPLKTESLTAFDWALEEEKATASPAYNRAREYFRNRLQVEATHLESQAEADGSDSESTQVTVEAGSIQSFCHQQGLTASNLFLASLFIVLSGYTGEEDLAIATISNGRTDIRLAQSYGMFVKTLPAIGKLIEKTPVSSFVKTVQEDAFAAVEHELFPLTSMSAEFDFHPSILYAYQGGLTVSHDQDGETGGLAFTVDNLELDKVKMPLLVNIFADDEFRIVMEYDGKEYSRSFIAGLAQAVASVAGWMAANPSALIEEVPLVSNDDQARLLSISKGSVLEYDKSQDTILRLFSKQAEITPDKPAVTFKGRSLTYRELDNQTDLLARHLVSMGIKPEDRVAVLIDRSEYMVVYPLAVLKAGAAYLPLDPTFPAERLEYMISDAGVNLILSEVGMVETHIPGFQGQVILKEEMDSILSEPTPVQLPQVIPHHAFVVLYTSGSTGLPKGCILEHHNLVNFCHWYKEFYGLTGDDNGVAYANFAFDAHMMDLYPFLISGCQVHIVPSEMRLDFVALNNFFEENHITLSFMTTMLGKQFLDTFDNRSLRMLTIGGESMPKVKLPDFILYNAYGPTECTIFTTVHLVDKVDDGRNIGRPIANYGCHILDRHLRFLPMGAVGELCISGAGVGRGYLNQPELTAEKFVDWQGQRLYRTGDYARWTPQGEIEFMGRIDGQVKLRGLRIELGEIEKKIDQYPGITGSAVAVKTIGGTEHLAAYYTSSKTIDIDDLKKALAADLTDFMIPTSFTNLDKIPLTANGKVNRKALPDPLIQKQESVLPRTATEELIYEFVAEVLGHQDFGVTDDLFTVGLTSLLAIKLSVLLWNKEGLELATNEILQGKTIEHMAKLADPDAEVPDTIPAEERKTYPLTGNQLGVFVDSEKNPGTLIYNIPLKITCKGEVDPDRLRNAVIRVINAHPYMKTQLTYEEGRPVQVRRDLVPAQVDIVRGRAVDEVATEFLRPFTLIDSDLYRAVVVEAKGSTTLLLDVHHIIFDGGSQSLFLEDLKSAFAGLPLQTESFTAFDFAIKEEEAMTSPAYSRAREYFQSKLQVEATRLTAQAEPGDEGNKVIRLKLDANKINSFCRRQGVTASNLFLASLYLVLSSYTGEEDIAIATISNGRADVRLSRTYGMFVKTLAAVGKIIKGTPVSSFVKTVQADAFETVKHEIFPLASMAAEFAFNPSIAYAYQGGLMDSHDQASEPDGLAFTVDYLELDKNKMPLAVNVFADEDFCIFMEYDGKDYSESFIRGLGQAMASVAEWMAANPDTPIEEAPLVSENDKNQLLSISQGPSLDYNRTLTFIDFFKAQAGKNPDQIAVVDCESQLSYQELDRQSDVLAGQLNSSAIIRGNYVGIMMPRRKDFLVSALAVMKAGGAYVPIDADYPEDRIEHILADSGAPVLLTVSSLEKAKSDLASTVILVDLIDFALEEGLTLPNPPTPADPAYMIYTSGSTGKPKGVTISHESLAALTVWCRKEFNIESDNHIFAYSSFSFDASVLEIFPSLTAGASLHIIDESMRYDLNALNRYISDNRVVGGGMSSQVGMEFLNQFDPPLRYMILGGEKLLPVKAKDVKLYNGYGPTEFTVASTFHIVDPDKAYDNIPIGRPVANSWNYVLDRDLKLLPAGAPGELCLAGRQIAQGYHKREDLTAGVFVPNPYATNPDNRMLYRTGDLVRWNKDFELEFVGRIDNQVKVRGFRIELGEIESILKRFSGIKACTVDVKKIGSGDQICAYYTETGNIDPHALKEHMEASLPDYMVPTVFIRLESLPLTPNGKINKKALPDPVLTSSKDFVPAENDLQALICKLYTAVLQIDQVGIDDDFFLIGGNSLLAMNLVTKCMQEGLSVVYEDIFKYKTPRRLWKKLAGEQGEIKTSPSIDYDYKEIDRLLQKNKIQDPASMALETVALGDILLTGATGFLGIHILRELLDSYDNKIYCLVRQKGDISGEARLKAMLHYYYEKDYADLFGSRIIIVDGDISQAENLTVDVQTVINCAANVKHFAQGDELDLINVVGVQKLIDYCKKKDASLVQVSTYSIGDLVRREADKITFSENRLYFGQDLENKYIHSKFMAERHVLEAAAQGLRAKVMRVGNLMSRHADGEFQINLNSNSFMGSLRAYKVLGVFPVSAAHDQVEFSPIDLTARAILHLSATSSDYTVFHPFNTHKVYMSDVVASLNDYGFPVEITDDKHFAATLQAKLQDDRLVKYLLGILAYQRGDEMQPLFRNQVDNRFSSDVLLRLGFSWPLTTETYLKRAIEALDGLGYFDLVGPSR